MFLVPHLTHVLTTVEALWILLSSYVGGVWWGGMSKLDAREHRNDFNAWEDVVGPLKESLLDSEGARNWSLLEPS